MTEAGWRTLVIHSKSDLRLADESLIICHEEQKQSVPLTQIRILIIENDSVTLSTALLMFYSFRLDICAKV